MKYNLDKISQNIECGVYSMQSTVILTYLLWQKWVKVSVVNSRFSVEIVEELQVDDAIRLEYI